MDKDIIKDILTIDEACAYLNLNKETVYNLVRAGDLPGRKVGNKWRFSKRQLREWVEENGDDPK